MAITESDIQTIKQRFGIIGSAPMLNNAVRVAMQVAPTEMSVLITGESGSGKESFSKIIHNLSPRKHGQFIAINCGSIFLDEIGEMPLGTQARLLRVLENGEFIKVGSSKVLKTDVRVVVATNVNLMSKVEAGKFREDLYYRLNSVP